MLPSRVCDVPESRNPTVPSSAAAPWGAAGAVLNGSDGLPVASGTHDGERARSADAPAGLGLTSPASGPK